MTFAHVYVLSAEYLSTMTISSISHSPIQNGLIAALPPADYDRMLPHLELVPMPLGWIVYEIGSAQAYAYFPTTSVMSMQRPCESGSSAEIAVTGNEGMLGFTLLMGSETSSNRVVVRGSGYAYRVRSDFMKSEFDQASSLQHSLMRYGRALITQMAQTAACNRYHTIEQRFCTWLLANADRLPLNELKATHESIASLLSVRREGITEAVGRLQTSGAIHSMRGKIMLIDRVRIEHLACECYGVVKTELQRLLPRPYTEAFSF